MYPRKSQFQTSAEVAINGLAQLLSKWGCTLGLGQVGIIFNPTRLPHVDSQSNSTDKDWVNSSFLMGVKKGTCRYVYYPNSFKPEFDIV